VDPAEDRNFAWGLFGLACVVGGGSLAIFGLRRTLSQERYLVLRTDGALFRNGSSQLLLRWEDVAEIRVDGACLAFEMQDGSEIARTERYAGIETGELARRAIDLRRKAVFGILR
jgi:hypothetical protein